MVYLFLSLSSPSTLIFEEPIEYVSAGKQGEFSIHRSNNQKILVIQPLKDVSETTMIVITKDHHYQFKIKTVEKEHHSYVYIFDGSVNKTYLKKVDNKDYRILEGDSSVLVQNKGTTPLDVNETKVAREDYFSKGAPLFINKARVLN